jgi:hypothetical protein
MALGILCTLTVVLGCGGGQATQIIGPTLRYEASTQPADSSGWGKAPTVLATLIVTNLADTTQHLRWADCVTGGPVRLRAYSTLGGLRRVWDSNWAYPGFDCILILHGRDVPPGGQWQFTLPVQVSRILGDSLPLGTYAFTVDAQELEPGKTGELPAGQLTLSAR